MSAIALTYVARRWCRHPGSHARHAWLMGLRIVRLPPTAQRLGLGPARRARLVLGVARRASPVWPLGLVAIGISSPPSSTRSTAPCTPGAGSPHPRRATGRYSMTATTSPAPTVSPGATLTSVTVPARLGLRPGSPSSWPRARRRPGRPRPRRPPPPAPRRSCPASGTVTRPAPARRGGAGPRRPPGRRAAARRPARRPPARSGTQTRTVVAPAVDLDVDVARASAGASAAGAPTGAGRPPRRRGRACSSTQRVEWRSAMKSGCSRIAQVGGDVGGDALDRHLPEGPQHAPPGLLAVGAPGDELGDEVVVVLADGVALAVAGVDAHAEAARAARSG